MTMNPSEYLEKKPICYTGKETGKKIIVSPADIIKIVINANTYLHALSDLFMELNFPIYTTLGQRNLSGFIGEVFSRVFVVEVDGFVTNPHADGRPDLLDVSSQDALEYFRSKCFDNSDNSRQAPSKACLTPFKYGGIEVKATIGNPVANYRTRLKKELGQPEFFVGLPRVNYLSSITYWGHHTSCENLIGLYYDYCEELDGVPQIMAVMHAELVPSKDWSKVSIGKAGSKKTSNTSLSSSGIEKIMKNPVAVRNHTVYLSKLRQIGLKI